MEASFSHNVRAGGIKHNHTVICLSKQFVHMLKNILLRAMQTAVATFPEVHSKERSYRGASRYG